MTEEVFVYDTYALIEIMNRNPSYEPYLDKKSIINDFIFAEFCYNLLKDKKEPIEEYTKEIENALIHAETKTIEQAMKFRYENKKKNLSMADCISYIMAKNLGIKFLTGDKEFEGLENVEFVK